MSKYTSKIEKFIYNEVHNDKIDLSDTHIPRIKDSETLQMINDVIHNTYIDVNSDQSDHYQVMSTYKMNAVHSKEDMPLLFLLFASLYSTGLLNPVFDTEYETLPNLNDFWEFHQWYRKNGPKINYDKIDRIISQLKDRENNTIIDLYRLIYHTDEPRSKLHKIYRNPFVSLDVQHDIESTDLVYQNIKISLNDKKAINSHICLDIFYADPDKYSDAKKPDLNVIAHIIRTMDSLHKKSKFTDVSTLQLTMIMSSQKKMFGDVEFLAADNVNSGSTYPGRSVTIWRIEEVYKVLIHELIHFYGFDFGLDHPSYDKLSKTLDQTIDLEGPDSINETYTETLATIINSLFCANYATNFGDLEQIQEKFESIISIEKYFLIWQVAKIINIYGGESMKELLDNKITLIQTTSVRSYYVYKLLMMFNLEDLVIFIDKKKDECGLNICDRLIEYGRLIITSYDKFKEKESVLTKIDENIKKIKTIVEEDGNDSPEYRVPWVYSTGRMTACEIHTKHHREE